MAPPRGVLTLTGTRLLLARHGFILLGLAVLAIPTIVRLGNQAWSTEAGAHGPIVIATGLWLLFHNRISAAKPGRVDGWKWLFPVLAGWSLYAFGRAYDFISLEAVGLYVDALVAASLIFGLAEIRRNLFPFFYLAFCVPPPGWVMDKLTLPLRTFVSFAAVRLLQLFDYPVAREGVTLTIAQYQLLVEDACSGMNSLTGLTAVSLFYIYLMHRASMPYAALLVTLIIPIAIFINIIRVLALILLTYYQGNAVAQGFLHETLGMTLFMLALVVIFLVDMAIQQVLRLGGRVAV